MNLPRLTGDRVTLRELELVDRDRIRAILTQPSVARWWGSETPDAGADSLLGPDEAAFAIEVGGRVIGVIEFSEEVTPDYRSAGIDLFLDTDHQDQGLGTEAVRLVARYLIEIRGHRRLTIDPAVANERAIRAYERVGFRRVGVMRRYERGHDGAWHDGLLMDLLAGELRERKPHERVPHERVAGGRADEPPTLLPSRRAHTTLPVAGLEASRAFWEGRLGFVPLETYPAAIVYSAGDGSVFAISKASARATGAHTQMAFRVPDIEAEVASLTMKGIAFETYDFPGLQTIGGIAAMGGNRVAWFKDPDGNLIGVIEFGAA